MQAYSIKVFGRVQGVNFRAMTKSFCCKSLIPGKILNEEDGSVKLLVKCSENKLKNLLKWLDSSPGFSKVENVVFEEVEVSDLFEGFEILRRKNIVFDKLRGVKNLGKRIFR